MLHAPHVRARWARATALVPLIAALRLAAQHSDQDLPAADSLREKSKLYEVMKLGELEGRFRQYSMLTVNDGAPSDYHAIAFGGTLGFASRRWHGVQFKLTGGYTFDLGSSDLTVPDPVTGLPNRYEIGLFDVTDPRHTNDLSYLHEFQLNYASRSGRTAVVFGKQEVNTPFLNPQDGRMHPTLFEGLWADHTTGSGTRFMGGWLYRVAPRGTSSWVPVAESMSVYPVGRDVTGKPSGFGEHLRSAGIFAGSVRQPLRQRVAITVWDLFVENVFNTAMAQLDMGAREDRWSLSAMGLYQAAVGQGAHAASDMAYLPAGEESAAMSARLRRVHGRFRWQLNYTRITAHGRYLMPREWGRDPFFTFLPRERNEGLGDVHAATLNLILRDAVKGLRIEVDGGTYWLPAIGDARLNKYAFPSYAQYVLNIQYQFPGGWKGLAVQLLYLYKMPLADQEVTGQQAFNKVDMHHLDLIINYVF